MVRISFFTCLFLICLRLVIGWHFFFEGLNKYESTKHEGAETSKPFSAAGYFTEAEGPAGPKVRELIGEPDTILIEKLTLAPSTENDLAAQMPASLSKEWDDYARQLVAFYHLSDEDKKRVDEKVHQAKSDYVLWLTDAKDDKKADKAPVEDDPRVNWIMGATVGEPALIYKPEDKLWQRIFTYKQFIAKTRADYEAILPKMGKDVEQLRLRTLKNKTADIRADLTKGVNEQTTKMKDSLAKIVGAKLAVDLTPADDPKIDERVVAMITLEGTGTDATAERMPTALGKVWDEYVVFLKANKQDKNLNSPTRIDEMLKDAKLRYVRYLLDLDQYNGTLRTHKEIADRRVKYNELIPKYLDAALKYNDAKAAADAKAAPAGKNAPMADKEAADAAKEALAAAKDAYDAAAKAIGSVRQEFIDDIKLHTDILKQNIGGFKAEKDKDKDYDSYKGIVEPEKETLHFLWRDWPELPSVRLEWLNAATRWFMLIAGGCLLLGLFTRLACFSCIVFLLIEVLSNTALPWLPNSPKSEGNYAFVNKNVVELFALLVLMTLPTGRWVGLDALLSCIWPFRSRRKGR